MASCVSTADVWASTTVDLDDSTIAANAKVVEEDMTGMLTLTENGAITLKGITQGELVAMLNAWDKLDRSALSLSDSDLLDLLCPAYKEHRLYFLRMCAAIRAFRNVGKGERELFRRIMRLMIPHAVDDIVHNIPEYVKHGRFDDFLHVCQAILELYAPGSKPVDATTYTSHSKFVNAVVEFMANTLTKDAAILTDQPDSMEKSLLAKWFIDERNAPVISIMVAKQMALFEFSGKIIKGDEDPLRSTPFDMAIYLVRCGFPLQNKRVPNPRYSGRKKDGGKLIQQTLHTNWRSNRSAKGKVFMPRHVSMIKSIDYGLRKLRTEFLSPLNKALKTLEVFLCDKSFIAKYQADPAAFPKALQAIPGGALKMYKKMLKKQLPEGFQAAEDAIKTGKIEVKGKDVGLVELAAPYLSKLSCSYRNGYKFVLPSGEDVVLEGQFVAILTKVFEIIAENFEKGLPFQSVCSVSDTSGSMQGGYPIDSKGKRCGPCALDVCVMMSIVTSLCNIMAVWPEMKESGMTVKDAVAVAMGRKHLPRGIKTPHFFRKGMSFTDDVTCWMLRSSSLHGMINEFFTQPVGYSTNVQAVFDLIIKMENDGLFTPATRIRRVAMYSDMQFNCGSIHGTSNLRTIFSKFRSNGIADSDIPEIVFWNVSGKASFHTSDVESTKQIGVAQMSGYSPTLITVLLYDEKPEPEVEKPKITPLEIFLRVVDNEIFQAITLPGMPVSLHSTPAEDDGLLD